MAKADLRGTEEQGATFVELFFDLVFVFAVTQVTGVLAHDLTPSGLARALIIFWLVWWAWTQFTWSLNEADTEHVAVRLLTLIATSLAFVMAVTIPLLTDHWGWLFPLSYLLVRVIGISLQWQLATGDAEWVRAVRTWTLMSSLGLIAVAAAVVGPPPIRYPALGIAAFLDVVAALRAGRSEWRIYPRHFAERHGLFVIIVLGESLIAAGISAGVQSLDGGVVAVTTIAVTGTCALWWTYFGWVKDALEEGLAAQPTLLVGRFARDVYSFAHFPLVFGVIGWAIAIEESVTDPQDPLPAAGLVALTLGLVAIVGSGAVALARAGIAIPKGRIAYLALAVVLLTLLGDLPSWLTLAVAAVLTTGLAVFERPSNSRGQD
ncbi:MAG TPA: low temperature requirement protein A [Acidimicrobiia bacterium]|nr:low temperature requirement protein A [Acidimicrobiia bacterium]